ncbi:uncharacterized protein V3H82_001481 [Fundulus diaphanus]
MEALDVQPSEEERVMTEGEESERNGEVDEGDVEASSPAVSSTEEETDEDSEPEPPPVIRRKVSFADAFGLNLVSVKEFDNAEATESEPSWSDGRKATQTGEEIYLSCLFTVPSSAEELDQRLSEQMVELESIELLPGTTTIRGTLRVVNLCYSKSVYARVTLDRWSSYFDLLAEYIPGSSDRKTDRFTFRYTVVPPFEKEGTRVEFCLRYETPMGTFWANNKGMNYVVFYHQKAQAKEHVTPTEEESSGFKSKRSCLKANRNGDTDDKTKESTHTNTAVADTEAAHKVEKTWGETTSLQHEDQKPWVESVKSRRRAIRLARVQDYLCQRAQQQPKAFPHESGCGQKVSQRVSAAQGDSSSYLYKSRKMQLSESPQILTYHQIPLLTLDWSSHTPEQPGTADVDHILTERAKMTLSKESKESTPPLNDMWESLPNTTHDSNTKEASESDAWQVFLNGPSCRHRSDVPESEWLQTAASVLPSNDKEPQIRYSEETREFQEGADTPTTLQTLAVCQLLSDPCETLLAPVALSAKDDQQAETRVSGAGDDNAVTQDASQRSQTKSVTDTPEEFNLKRAPPLSTDSADSPAERHRHKDWEQDSKGVIGTAGSGEGEPFTLHTPDSVTSSGESKTTDMTGMPETPNASNVDTISPDASQEGRLSSCGEREVTGTAHNAVDDILAFRETIRDEKGDRDSYVFSASRQGEEEEITMNHAAKKVPAEGKTFRPQECKECNIPLRYADKIQHEEFRQSPNREINENETGKATKDKYGFETMQRCEKKLEKNSNISMDVKKDDPSNNQKMAVIKKEVRAVGTQSKETQEVTGEGSKLIKILDEVQLTNEDRSSILHIEENRTQSSPVQVNEKLHVEKREDLPRTQIKQCDKQKSRTGQQEMSFDRKVMEQKETSSSTLLSPTVDTLEVCQISHDTQIARQTDRYGLNPLEVVEVKLTDTWQDSKRQKRDSSRDINPEEVMAKGNGAQRDTSAEHRSKTSRGTKLDQSQDDEKVCVRKQKIEAVRELMGNPEGPRGENKNAWKEQESSTEVKCSPHAEYKKPAERTKDPIMVGNSAALEATQSELEQMFIERFGDNLVCSIWEEVFAREVRPFTWHTNTVGDTKSGRTDVSQDCCPIYEKSSRDTVDSGASLLAEFPSDSAGEVRRGREHSSVTEGNECSPKDKTQPLTMAEHSHSPPQLHTGLDSIAHLSPILHREETMFEPAQSLGPPKDQENSSKIKARSVPRPEKDFEIENFDRSPHLSIKHQRSSEKLEESDALLWWTVLYTISHITRLLICSLLVGGFFVVVFLYDFPAFFALYIFSMSWWIFKWKRHQMITGSKATE